MTLLPSLSLLPSFFSHNTFPLASQTSKTPLPPLMPKLPPPKIEIFEVWILLMFQISGIKSFVFHKLDLGQQGSWTIVSFLRTMDHLLMDVATSESQEQSI